MPDEPVLAIGLDSADAPFVRELIARGELPVLAALEREGRRGRIESPASLGSTAVWPTFVNGAPASEHGFCSSWSWDPDTMNVFTLDTARLRPFWTTQANGAKIGVLDIPLRPPTQPAGGFDVTEWGTHEFVLGRTQVWPEQLT